MSRIRYLIILFWSLAAYGAGAWYQSVGQIPEPKFPVFDPDFVIVKAGIFSREGALKTTIAKHQWKKYCTDHRETVAWITHRLSPKESLSPLSGERLAKETSQALAETCVNAIELDIEPLEKFEPWLADFLKSVRTKLDSKLKLRLAIPSLAAKRIPGLYWKLSEAVQILPLVDGLDVMLYDSGLTSETDYGELFRNAFTFAMELVKEADDKTIILGLPAYQDKTVLHALKAENLISVLNALKPFTPFQLKNFCLNRVRFAYYAGWTLSEVDKKTHSLLEEWKAYVCKKDK